MPPPAAIRNSEKKNHVSYDRYVTKVSRYHGKVRRF